MSSSLVSQNTEGEIIKINPYNVNNRLITQSQVQHILRSQEINLPIGDLSYYQKSFVHKSYCKKKDQENDGR